MSAMMQWTGLGEVVVRTSAIYVFLLTGLRLAGKREIGQMTTFDLVVILVISNAVQNAMVGENSSLTGGMVSAATLLALNYVVSWLRYRSPWLDRLLGGSPTDIIRDGKLLTENLAREGLEAEEVLMAMREHGVNEVKDVKLAVLERDGSISVVPKEGHPVKRKRRVRFLKKGV